MPNSEEIADIAEEAAGVARRLGFTPRVRCSAYSTFGNPSGERAEKVRDAVRILDSRHVDFEYDGEMGADVALNPDVMAAFPFCRLSGPANVLVMPARHSAAISTKMLQELGGTTGARTAPGRLRPPGADPADLGSRCRHRQHGRTGGIQYQRVSGDGAGRMRYDARQVRQERPKWEL
jgi:hypothetical protein